MGFLPSDEAIVADVHRSAFSSLSRRGALSLTWILGSPRYGQPSDPYEEGSAPGARGDVWRGAGGEEGDGE